MQESPTPLSVLGPQADAERQKIRQQFEADTSVRETLQAICELADNHVRQIFGDVLRVQKREADGLCLLALGGCGRRMLFPYYDPHVLFLLGSERTEQEFRPLISDCTRTLGDLAFCCTTADARLPGDHLAASAGGREKRNSQYHRGRGRDVRRRGGFFECDPMLSPLHQRAQRQHADLRTPGSSRGARLGNRRRCCPNAVGLDAAVLPPRAHAEPATPAVSGTKGSGSVDAAAAASQRRPRCKVRCWRE